MTMTMEQDEEVRPQLVPWPDFVRSMRWIQGEHVGLIGPTGCGKTNLAFWLLPQRKFVTIFATKPRDTALTAFAKTHQYKMMHKWENISIKKFPRRILWPNSMDLRESVLVQHKEFTIALDKIYPQGAWTIYFDELWWICVKLKMTETVKTLLQQARSLDESLVVATQRPSWVPLEVYDQSTHLFFWRDTDERNLRRLSGISWINARVIVRVIATLPMYHVLYVNTRTGKMMVTRPPAPERIVK